MQLMLICSTVNRELLPTIIWENFRISDVKVPETRSSGTEVMCILMFNHNLILKKQINVQCSPSC